MRIVYGLVKEHPQSSTAATVNVNDPAVLGVPCNIPPIKFNPGGKVPTTEYVTGHMLSVVKVCLGYTVPTNPAGRLFGVIEVRLQMTSML